MSSNIRILKICQHCNEEFTAKTTVTKYCGDRCAKRAYKARKKAEKIEQSKVSERERFEAKVKRNIEPEVLNREFLSIEQCAKLLGASKMTIYRNIRNGNIKAGKLGRRTIIKRSEIDKLFE